MILDKQKAVEDYTRMTLMWVILGKKGNSRIPEMFWVRCQKEEEVYEALEMNDIKPIEVKLFTQFANDGKIDFIPKRLRKRTRKRKS